MAAQGRSLLLSQGTARRKAGGNPSAGLALQEQLPDWLLERLEVFRRVLQTLTVELKGASDAIAALAPAPGPKDWAG